MTFGERLRAERKRIGLSGRALSRAACMNPTYAWEVETGRVIPPIDVAIRLAAGLGLTLADLMIDGPALMEVVFDAGIGDDEHGVALGCLPVAARASVGMWPPRSDGALRLRVRASALPLVVTLSVPGRVIPPPTVSAVSASSTLAVMFSAPRRADVVRMVLAETTRVDCCPPIEVERVGSRWVAKIMALPERCSIALQRLAPDAPIGLYHPA